MTNKCIQVASTCCVTMIDDLKLAAAPTGSVIVDFDIQPAAGATRFPTAEAAEAVASLLYALSSTGLDGFGDIEVYDATTPAQAIAYEEDERNFERNNRTWNGIPECLATCEGYSKELDPDLREDSDSSEICDWWENLIRPGPLARMNSTGGGDFPAGEMSPGPACAQTCNASAVPYMNYHFSENCDWHDDSNDRDSNDRDSDGYPDWDSNQPSGTVSLVLCEVLLFIFFVRIFC